MRPAKEWLTAVGEQRWRHAKDYLIRRERLLYLALAVLLAVQVWENVAAPDGPKSHLREIGGALTFLCMLGISVVARLKGRTLLERMG